MIIKENYISFTHKYNELRMQTDVIMLQSKDYKC